MNSKKLSAAIAIAVMLTAILVASASASITTEAAKFYVGGAALSTATTADAKGVTHTGSEAEFTMKGKVGAPTSISLHLSSRGLECIECVGQNQVTSTKTGTTIGVVTGKLRFDEIVVDEPAVCHISSELGVKNEMLTKQLTFHFDLMHEGKAFVNIFPSTGTVFAKLNVTGSNCEPVAGPYNITGTLFGEDRSKTTEASILHEIELSPSIQTTTGAELKLGGNKLEWTGTLGLSLTSAATTRASYSVKP